nr:site-specific integrase [Pediococcus pentosaceus]
MSLQDYSKLMSLIETDDPFYMPVNISFYTALRHGEVSGLEWSNVDLDNKTIKVTQQLIQYKKGNVRVSTPKTENSYRTIPIGDTLIKMLQFQKLLQKSVKCYLG